MSTQAFFLVLFMSGTLIAARVVRQDYASEVSHPKLSQVKREEISSSDKDEGNSSAEEDNNDGAYSFSKFTGPLSGEVQEVTVTGKDGQKKVDYVGKPDYSFSYGVLDPHTGNYQQQEETRTADAVHGQYKVLQPDGKTRVVTYTADAINGFQVKVEYI